MIRIYLILALFMVALTTSATETTPEDETASVTTQATTSPELDDSTANTKENSEAPAPSETQPANTQDKIETEKQDKVVSKEKVLSTINRMTVEEIAELMNFVSTMEEEYGLSGPTLTVEEALQEKIAHTIEKMSPIEIAELMNFITTMEARLDAQAVTTLDDNDVVFAIPEAVKKTLERIVKADPKNVAIAPSPIPGLYEAVIKTEVVYISTDGRYIVMGDIRETETGKNITDEKREQLRAQTLNTANESEMIVFAPKGKTQYTINVFTDVDCPYCSKFHLQVDELNKGGVKVRYLAFPRAGKGSKTYNTMVSVWCAEDPQQALTDAKAQKPVESKTCDNPVTKQYELGKTLGVTGTPAMILSNGELIPGYVPAEKLIGYLKQKLSSEE
ncbi:MAG: DsbC family protein [Pseudomonadota bacterium]|nr:DsbC family protein [Pseudomonadota bacterium]